LNGTNAEGGANDSERVHQNWAIPPGKRNHQRVAPVRGSESQRQQAGGAQGKLLDIYEAERIAFARRLVATTDRVFNFVTAEGRIVDIIRTRVAPVLIPTAMAFEAARE
jgi:hypothetical protein